MIKELFFGAGVRFKEFAWWGQECSHWSNLNHSVHHSYFEAEQGLLWHSFTLHDCGQKCPAELAGEDWSAGGGDRACWSLRINDQQDQTGQTWAPCWNTQLYTAYETLDLKNKTNRIPGNWSTIYRQAQIWTVIDQLQMVWYDTHPLFTAAIFTLFST